MLQPASRLSPVWLVLTGILSVQFGAAVAKHLFDVVSPTAMVWLRLASSAVVLVAMARPRLRGRTRDDWLVAVAFGLALVTMNWTIYQSFARIPLGLAVTIEFVGPLTLAVLGSRRARDLVWVGLAAAGGALPDRRRGHEADQRRHLVHRLDEGASPQMDDQAEDVALAVRQRVEPALAAVDADDDRRLAAIFDRLARAFLHVEREALALQHGSAGHLVLQFSQIWSFHARPRTRCAPLPSCSRSELAEQDPEAAKSKAGKGAARN